MGDYYDSFDCEISCEEYYESDQLYTFDLSPEDEAELNELFGE